MDKAPATSKGAGWEWAHSLWILWTILNLGWIAFLYVGIRVRYRAWIVWGIIYLTLFSVGASSSGSTFGTIVVLIAFVGPIIHAFRIRKKYLTLLAQKQARSSRVDEVQSNSTTVGRYHDAFEQTQSQERSPSTRHEVSSRPPPHTASSDYPERSSTSQNVPTTLPQEQLIDLNGASEEQLASLPGTGLIIAKRAVKLREQGRRFTSVDDFGEALGIASHNVDRIRPLVTTSQPSAEDNRNTQTGSSGRIVDF